MKRLLFVILSVIILNLNLYALTFETYFNQYPSYDAVDTILISKIEQLNTGSRLDLCIYDIDRANIISALSNAAVLKNIKVNIIVERDATDSATAHLASISNITVVSDNNSLLMHNKFIIFDYNGSSSLANEIWTGSLNLTDNGIDKNAQNVIVLQNKNLATEYSNEFYQMFRDNKYGTAKTAHTIHSFQIEDSTVEVYFSPKDSPKTRLIQLINSATSSIYFCIFTFSDVDVVNAVKAKFSAGIDVRGVCDGWSSANYSTSGIYTVATQIGMPVYKDKVLGKPDSGYYLLHHKFMVIDHKIVVTGSYNWTPAGNDSNDENTLVIHNEIVAEKYFDEFKARYKEAGGSFPENVNSIKNFIAYPSYPDGIRLKWTNPNDDFFKEVKIYYSETGYPETTGAGIFLTNVIGTKNENKSIVVHNNFFLHTRYYFTAFAYNEANNFTNSYTSCIYISPEDTGTISDNLITEENAYKNIEIYFKTDAPDKVYIYNTTGNLIKEIESFDNKKFIWDLKCPDETSVGSGLYFLVYYLNGDRKTKKILIAR